jgi:hypothetical protein
LSGFPAKDRPLGFSSAGVEVFTAKNNLFAGLVSEERSFRVMVEDETGLRSGFSIGQ